MSIKIDLAGKNILITGANGGIGCAIVLKFLEAGANCYCLDKNLGNVKKIKIKKNFFSKINLLKVDLEKKIFRSKILKEIKKNVKIHVLINNAGFSKSQQFSKYSIKNWKKTIDINLTAPFLVSQLISKNFMVSGASIINITSIAAELGFSENVAYVASKGGLKQLTKAMALDLAKKNIRVNSIGPGYVKTRMTKGSWLNKKKKKKIGLIELY